MFTNKYYTRVYLSTVTKAVARNFSKAKGRERHHIIPQSLGGTNDKNNLVYLTCREHFLCHWLLLKITTGENRHKMMYAFMGMRAENEYQTRYITIFTARVYEKYRIEHAAHHSEVMKAKNLVPWNKGRKLEGIELETHLERTRNRKAMSPETKAKWIAARIKANTGSKRSDETRAKMSAAAKGKLKGPMSDEQKLKRSLKQTGIAKPLGFGEKVADRMRKEFSENNPNRRKDLQKTCPHCGITVGPSNFTRWHGDNCKLKETK